MTFSRMIGIWANGTDAKTIGRVPGMIGHETGTETGTETETETEIGTETGGGRKVSGEAMTVSEEKGESPSRRRTDSG